MTETHTIEGRREAVYSAGKGREHLAALGVIEPNLTYDDVTLVELGWDCSCGETGSTSASAWRHWQELEARRKAGEAIDGTLNYRVIGL